MRLKLDMYLSEMVAPKDDLECIKGFKERLFHIKAKHIEDGDRGDLLFKKKKKRHIRSAGRR